MATLTQTLGLTRKIFKEAYVLAAASTEAQWKGMVREESTTEGFIIKKQVIPIGNAKQTNEGEVVHYDDPKPLYQASFTPVTFTLGTLFSKQAKFTLQYLDNLLNRKEDWVNAFLNTKNQAAANLYNLAFTSTTMGMNGEALISTTHNVGNGVTVANRPALDLALSPLAIEQGLIELRKQKDPNGNPMGFTGDVDLIVPPALAPAAYRYVEANNLATTNNNDPNYIKRRVVNVVVNDFLTSDTAWFLKAKKAKGPFLLQQMPFDVEELPMRDDLMYPIVASESYVPGWDNFYGIWGTTGA